MFILALLMSPVAVTPPDIDAETLAERRLRHRRPQPPIEECVSDQAIDGELVVDAHGSYVRSSTADEIYRADPICLDDAAWLEFGDKVSDLSLVGNSISIVVTGVQTGPSRRGGPSIFRITTIEYREAPNEASGIAPAG